MTYPMLNWSGNSNPATQLHSTRSSGASRTGCSGSRRFGFIDEQAAADACQEVFVRGYKGLRRFRFRSAPFTWLYRTTRNVCHEFNRVRRTEALDEEPMDARSVPEHEVAAHDSARRVRQLVSRLPERQREVVMLRMFEDLSVRETALAMGCREGTVKALLHKATSRLRISMNSGENNND